MLALQLGVLDVDAVLESMTPEQLEEWALYFTPDDEPAGDIFKGLAKAKWRTSEHSR